MDCSRILPIRNPAGAEREKTRAIRGPVKKAAGRTRVENFMEMRLAAA
jgi:hypothetical protein